MPRSTRAESVTAMSESAASEDAARNAEAAGAICALDVASADVGRELATRLGWMYAGLCPAWRQQPQPFLLLVSAQDGLALARTGPAAPAPVRADFSSPRLLHRLRGIGPRREDIARAVGLPASRPIHVLDATAGWGGDSVVLAALGCEITMIERSPVLVALLEDGLARLARSDAAISADLHARLRLLAGDARALMRSWQEPPPDVVLLDPMYPERGASAAARKEMAILQALLGGDEDADELLDVALALAQHRVVVKRPRAAPPLAGRVPTHRIEGRSTRFDVYALRRMP